VTKIIDEETVTPEMFIGKTIKSLDIKADNNLIFEFTDGEKLALHVDATWNGIPYIRACNVCIDELQE
jgi:hypothetical protein